MRSASTALLAALLIAVLPAHATIFSDGEFVTHAQLEYGTFNGVPFDPEVAALLENNFNSVFAPSGFVQVGIPGPAGFAMIFSSADTVIAYLPTAGDPSPLDADLLDPTSSASGVLGGEVLAATLNVAFSAAGLLAHPPGVAFGDLVFQNLDTLVGTIIYAEQTLPFGPEIAELDGMSMYDVLSEANLVLGGGASLFTPWDMFTALDIADSAFSFGLLHPNEAAFLAFPPVSGAVPEPSTWAMMMLGFAGLGYAAYRRARVD